jgi:hypothetical protein
LSHFFSLLYCVIIPSAISDYSSSHPNNKLHAPAPDPPVLLAVIDVCLVWLLCSYVCMSLGSFFLHPPCFPHKLYHLPIRADLFGLNFTNTKLLVYKIMGPFLLFEQSFPRRMLPYWVIVHMKRCAITL